MLTCPSTLPLGDLGRRGAVVALRRTAEHADHDQPRTGIRDAAPVRIRARRSGLPRSPARVGAVSARLSAPAIEGTAYGRDPWQLAALARHSRLSSQAPSRTSSGLVATPEETTPGAGWPLRVPDESASAASATRPHLRAVLTCGDALLEAAQIGGGWRPAGKRGRNTFRDSPLLAPTLDLLAELGPLPDAITVHLDAGRFGQVARPARRAGAARPDCSQRHKGAGPGHPAVACRARPRLAERPLPARALLRTEDQRHRSLLRPR